MEKNQEKQGAYANVAYQAVTSIRDIKQYGDELADAIRNIKHYSPKQLEENKITKEGKIDAEGLWSYLNNLVEGRIGKFKYDVKDPRWKASYNAVKSIVERFGAKGITADVLEALLNTYVSTANSYIDEKDQAFVASLPTADGKSAVKDIAGLTGNGKIYGKWIDGATEPTQVAGIKAQIEPELRTKVTTAIATGTIDDLVADAQKSSK